MTLHTVPITTEVGNKVLITLEINLNDDLIARNAINGQVITFTNANVKEVPGRRQVREVLHVINSVTHELIGLIVDRSDDVAERYT